MDPNELVEVYTTTKVMEAEVIKNLLEGEGIPCEVANETQAGLTGLLSVPVLVRASDQERARELISTHGESGRLETEDRFRE